MAKIARFKQAGLDCTMAAPNNACAKTPTIICLHGIGGDDQSFLPQLEYLSEYFKVVAWNMPGYGDSNNLDDVSFHALADSLKNLVEFLQIADVHLIGHSIGGMIAQEFAYRYPQQVHSLVLIATTSAFGGKDERFKHSFLEARLAPLDKGLSMPELAEQSIHHIISTACPDNVKKSATKSMASIDELSYRNILKCLVTFNRRTELSLIKCPVCLISGSEDNNAPPTTMKKMADKIPNSQYHEIKDVGHLVNLENPAEVNQIIHQFLSETIAHD